MSKIKFGAWTGWKNRSNLPDNKCCSYKANFLKYPINGSRNNSSIYAPQDSYTNVTKGEDLQFPTKETKTMHDRCARILQSLEGKTIQVTVVSIDIVNSSEKIRAISGELAGEYYRTFIETMSDMIQYHGGYVLKNVGDCVIGFFPCGKYIVENHDHAVSCGLAMRDMVRDLLDPYFRERKFPSIACRVSADFGEAKVLGISSNGDYSTIDLFGSAMNAAAKILHYPRPNQMVVGEKLLDELIDEQEFVFKSVNRFDVTGKHSYPVYLVERKK